MKRKINAKWQNPNVKQNPKFKCQKLKEKEESLSFEF